MHSKSLFIFLITITSLGVLSFRNGEETNPYLINYHKQMENFSGLQNELLEVIQESNPLLEKDRNIIRLHLEKCRTQLKSIDFWLRYLDPLAHKKINGPLPVEWETEVFEKFESPYKREGAGFTLAWQCLEELPVDKRKLTSLLTQSILATKNYSSDSVMALLASPDHFFLCNRLYLLNLATLYTTGFDCPDTARIIPELEGMMISVKSLYLNYNRSFSNARLSSEYLELYETALAFLKSQPSDFTSFDHYTFIRDFVNPLFILNQTFIHNYTIRSKSMLDYSLNKKAESIFSKTLYAGQGSKGIFLRSQDPKVLRDLDVVGKMLFFDPILSGNNQRSCASCHIPSQYYTDTTGSAMQFDQKAHLARNTPSLLNVPYQHLIMLDGKHSTLLAQTKGVILSEVEMGGTEKEVVRKVMSCKKYAATFTKLLKETPLENEVTIDHISSAIIFYYSKFSNGDAPFDDAMNRKSTARISVQKGFNLFMGKAQCATCHFAPQFNGVKPPYIGSEFEVIGVPGDSSYSWASKDKGRYLIHPAPETLHAFRTTTIRNTSFTKPYMHNGAFNTLEQVIDFYDGGGGNGHGFNLPNQTLKADSLHLTKEEKYYLIEFIHALDERVLVEKVPKRIPASTDSGLNKRTVGGTY